MSGKGNQLTGEKEKNIGQKKKKKKKKRKKRIKNKRLETEEVNKARV